MMQGNQSQYSVITKRGGMVREEEGSFKRDGTYVQ